MKFLTLALFVALFILVAAPAAPVNASSPTESACGSLVDAVMDVQWQTLWEENVSLTEWLVETFPSTWAALEAWDAPYMSRGELVDACTSLAASLSGYNVTFTVTDPYGNVVGEASWSDAAGLWVSTGGVTLEDVDAALADALD